MTDRPPAERADLEHGDECRSLWADDRICDCGAETIRDLRAEVERLTASADRFARALDQDRRDLVKDWNAEVYNARKDRDQERRMADATAVHLTQALEKVAALEGVCRNHEGTISVMNEGLRATMAREDLLAAQVATLTAERDAAREEVAMGRKAMGVLAFEMERLKAERDSYADTLNAEWAMGDAVRELEREDCIATIKEWGAVRCQEDFGIVISALVAAIRARGAK